MFGGWDVNGVGEAVLREKFHNLKEMGLVATQVRQLKFISRWKERDVCTKNCRCFPFGLELHRAFPAEQYSMSTPLDTVYTYVVYVQGT